MKRNILVLLILNLIFFITVFFTFITFRYFYENGRISKPFKQNIQVFKKVIQKEYLKYPHRFTIVFNKNNPTGLKKYKKQYDNFFYNEERFINEINKKIPFINLSDKANILPSIDTGDFLLTPLKPVIIDDNKLTYEIEKIFKYNENKFIYNDKIIIEYLYISINNNKVIFLIFPPYDPDPLFPENRRNFIIIGYEQNSNLPYKESFILNKLKTSYGI